MEKVVASAFLILAPLVVSFEPPPAGGARPLPDYLSPPLEVTTKTGFSEETKVVRSTLPFGEKLLFDPELDYGVELVAREGQSGELIRTFRVKFWDGGEVSRELDKTERVEPVDRIVRRGEKVVWRELMTEALGGIRYWAKITVFATSYDGNCSGCRGLTRSGTAVRRGVCATDPRLIPLGTNFYVPGYGLCRAEDTGGAVKGRRVDLGFEDVSRGWWSARDVEIYLLTRP